MSRGGTCTYCLRPVERITDDHVFPASWYTENTPANLEKPKVPACAPCNNEKYSKIEARLRERFALSYGLGDAKVAGVQEPAQRAIDPESTEDAHEKRVRAAKRSKLYREIAKFSVPPEPPPGSIVVPGFGPDELGADPSIRVPVEGRDLHDFAEKLARGMTFLQTGKLIGPEYAFDGFLPSEAQLQQILATLPGAVESVCGPAFSCIVGRAVDSLAAIFIFTIWGRLTIVTAIEPTDPPQPEV